MGVLNLTIFLLFLYNIGINYVVNLHIPDSASITFIKYIENILVLFGEIGKKGDKKTKTILICFFI